MSTDTFAERAKHAAGVLFDTIALTILLWFIAVIVLSPLLFIAYLVWRSLG